MFEIKFNKTKKIGEIDVEDTSVGEAIWSVYPEYKVDVFIQWKDYLITLDKRGTISDIYNDIIYILNSLNEGDTNFRSSFLCSGFTAYWDFSVENNRIKINPQFFEIGMKYNNEYLEMEEIRKLDLDIEIDFDYFIGEWNKLLKSIKEDLLKVGYTQELENFKYLRHL